MTPHTPGPWKGVGNGWIDGNGLQLARVFSLNPVNGFDRNPSWREAEANARLIAAAPELLLAIQGLLDWAECNGDGTETLPIFVEARAAIAKAEGKS